MITPLINIDIFNLPELFSNGELATEREANTCPVCGCLFAWDDRFCSEDCEDEFNRNKKFESDNHYNEDFDEEQNF